MPLRPSVPLLLPLLALTQCIMQGEGAYPVQPMPAATQTGANTAGCFVDGLPWVANYYDTTIDVPTPAHVTARWRNASTGGGHLSLRFLKDIADRAQVHHDTALEIELPDVTRPGTFVLDQLAAPRTGRPNPAYAAFTFYKPTPDQELLTGPGSPGRVVVTRLDTISRVVSGTFEFEARQASTGTAVRVTEGRFDRTF